MPYLVSGNAKWLAQQLDMDWLNYQGELQAQQRTIENDLPRTLFLGTPKAAQHHIEVWQKEAHVLTYTQGDMEAANLTLFLQKTDVFKTDEEIIHYWLSHKSHSFAYVNEQQEVCGFSVLYKKDDPAFWLLVHSKDTYKAPQHRQVALLASFDLEPYMKNAASVVSVDRLNNPFLEQISHGFLKSMLEHALASDDGLFDTHFDRIHYLLRHLQIETTPVIHDPLNWDHLFVHQLFADNECLDTISQAGLSLTMNLFLTCLDKTSALCKEIKARQWTEDKDINICLLKMTLIFYEQNLLSAYSDALKPLFDKTKAGEVWNDQQIHLIPFLLKADYPSSFINDILANPTWYTTLALLIELNYTQDFRYLLSLPVKREALTYFATIKENQLKQLCLIFWVKENLTYEEYEQIIKACHTHSYLTSLLIVLDKTQEYGMEELRALALHPINHAQEFIWFYYGSSIKSNDLNGLTLSELQRLINALEVLKRDSAHRIAWAVKNTAQGRLLRLFLPTFSGIEPSSYRNEFIDLLYDGVCKGPILLHEKIKQLKDQSLQTEVHLLQERLICAQQMQHLNLDDALIDFAAELSPAAQTFRTIILKVEAQCKIISSRMFEAQRDKKQKDSWKKASHQYRKELYKLAYEAIKNPGQEIQPQLTRIQKAILETVDPIIKSWAHWALVVLANLLIMTLTLTLANQIKYKKTQNFWFFNQSQSEEELHLLETEVVQLLGLS